MFIYSAICADWFIFLWLLVFICVFSKCLSSCIWAHSDREKWQNAAFCFGLALKRLFFKGSFLKVFPSASDFLYKWRTSSLKSVSNMFLCHLSSTVFWKHSFCFVRILCKFRNLSSTSLQPGWCKEGQSCPQFLLPLSRAPSPYAIVSACAAMQWAESEHWCRWKATSPPTTG